MTEYERMDMAFSQLVKALHANADGVDVCVIADFMGQGFTGLHTSHNTMQIVHTDMKAHNLLVKKGATGYELKVAVPAWCVTGGILVGIEARDSEGPSSRGSSAQLSSAGWSQLSAGDSSGLAVGHRLQDDEDTVVKHRLQDGTRNRTHAQLLDSCNSPRAILPVVSLKQLAAMSAAVHSSAGSRSQGNASPSVARHTTVRPGRDTGVSSALSTSVLQPVQTFIASIITQRMHCERTDAAYEQLPTQATCSARDIMHLTKTVCKQRASGSSAVRPSITTVWSISLGSLRQLRQLCAGGSKQLVIAAAATASLVTRQRTSLTAVAPGAAASYDSAAVSGALVLSIVIVQPSQQFAGIILQNMRHVALSNTGAHDSTYELNQSSAHDLAMAGSRHAQSHAVEANDGLSVEASLVATQASSSFVELSKSTPGTSAPEQSAGSGVRSHAIHVEDAEMVLELHDSNPRMAGRRCSRWLAVSMGSSAAVLSSLAWWRRRS